MLLLNAPKPTLRVNMKIHFLSTAVHRRLHLLCLRRHSLLYLLFTALTHSTTTSCCKALAATTPKLSFDQISSRPFIDFEILSVYCLAIVLELHTETKLAVNVAIVCLFSSFIEMHAYIRVTFGANF